MAHEALEIPKARIVDTSLTQKFKARQADGLFQHGRRNSRRAPHYAGRFSIIEQNTNVARPPQWAGIQIHRKLLQTRKKLAFLGEHNEVRQSTDLVGW